MPNSSSPPPQQTPPLPDPPRTSQKGSHFLLYGCGGILAFLLLIVTTVMITVWWIQRPIRPVVLTPREKAVVDQKLLRLENATPGGMAGRNRKSAAPSTVPDGQIGTAFGPTGTGAEQDDRQLRIYVPGSKELKITEREINGLLNANTDLGKSVRLEFAQDAINAYIAVR